MHFRSTSRAPFALALVLTLSGGAACAQAPSAPAAPASAAAVHTSELPSYSLAALLALTRETHPALAAERARLDGASAAVRSARAHPNPEVEWLTGRQRPVQPGTTPGRTQSWGVTQPLEWPGLRRARAGAALAERDSVQAGVQAFEQSLLAQLKLRYYAVLRAQAEARNAEQDLSLASQIHARVRVRVDTGEAPRFELIRAETERLNAQRAVQTAVLRVSQVQADLRRTVGPALPADYRLQGSIEDTAPPAPDVTALRTRLLERHPELVAARAELRSAESRLTLEQQRRLPALALRAGIDREPDLRANRIGVVVSVPLFDRREGPIGEAQATVLRLRSALADRELQLAQSLEMAWQQYQISLGQVQAYESGIVRQSAAALEVAEAAYRFGERGILEYLDAQRSYRLARNELSVARFELRAALVELERLSAEAAANPATDPTDATEPQPNTP